MVNYCSVLMTHNGFDTNHQIDANFALLTTSAVQTVANCHDSEAFSHSFIEVLWKVAKFQASPFECQAMGKFTCFRFDDCFRSTAELLHSHFAPSLIANFSSFLMFFSLISISNVSRSFTSSRCGSLRSQVQRRVGTIVQFAFKRRRTNIGFRETEKV
jgi:hypothetical protein